MRYLAILKDSFREVWDSKVLYVLLSLTTIAILFVGTISFKPLSAEQTMGQFFLNRKTGMPMIYLALNWHTVNQHKTDPVLSESLFKSMQLIDDYRLTNVELLRGEPDSPNSDYRLTVAQSWRFGQQPKPDEAGKDIAKIREIFQGAVDLDLIRLGEVEPAPKEKPGAVAQYLVTVYATPRTNRIWAAEPSLFFNAFPIEIWTAPLGLQLYLLSAVVVEVGSWLAVLLAVIITSFFIPNMLAKGTIDMLLVKPISRWPLLLYKYFGGLTFILLINAYAIGGMWLMLGLRTGLWANGALLLICTLTFYFAILYAISTFVAVLTPNTIATILLTILAWMVFFGIGLAHGVYQNRQNIEYARQGGNQPLPEDQRWGESYAADAVGILHAVMPRASDLNTLNDRLMYSGFVTGSIADMNKFDTEKLVWWESLLVSGGWIAFFLLVSCIWFSLRDY